jgi:oligopeptide transport system permease protein
MASFIVKRLAGGLLTLFVIATLCFFITRFAPGSPLTGERNLPPEVVLNLERAYHLDKPLLVQYGLVMGGYLRGDFGMSFKYHGRPVADFIAPSFPVSVQLGLLAFVFSLAAGTSLGLLAAANQNRAADHAAMSVALAGICLPNFLVGPVLVMVFSLALGWLPSAGWPESAAPAELVKLLLPALTLSLAHVAYVSRLARAGLLDVLRKDYIRTARAKGLPASSVLFKHALKNGITPVVSYAGPMAAYLLTGSVVVERIFNLPGLGQHFIDGALSRDYSLIMGCMLVYGALVIAFNLAVDLAYSFLDPRVRLA